MGYMFELAISPVLHLPIGLHSATGKIGLYRNSTAAGALDIWVAPQRWHLVHRAGYFVLGRVASRHWVTSRLWQLSPYRKTVVALFFWVTHRRWQLTALLQLLNHPVNTCLEFIGYSVQVMRLVECYQFQAFADTAHDVGHEVRDGTIRRNGVVVVHHAHRWV